MFCDHVSNSVFQVLVFLEKNGEKNNFLDASCIVNWHAGLSERLDADGRPCAVDFIFILGL